MGPVFAPRCDDALDDDDDDDDDVKEDMMGG